MAPLHSLVALWLAPCTAAVVFQHRGSANRTGKMASITAREASYRRVLTKPSSPIFQRHNFDNSLFARYSLAVSSIITIVKTRFH
jgi:hypothetical protein